MEARVQRWRTALIAAASALFAGAIAGSAYGASLAVGNPAAPEGKTFAFPVILKVDAPEQVAALQFDASFGPKEFVLAGKPGASPGKAAQAADKSVHAASIRPGLVRVIIAGLNQNVIAGGEVAVMHFECYGPPSNAAGKISLTNVVMSDPAGNEVDVPESSLGPAGMGSGPRVPAGASGKTHSSAWSQVVLVSIVLTLAAASWYFLAYYRAGNRRRTRP